MKKIVFISIFLISVTLYSAELPRIVILETMTLESLQDRTNSLIRHLSDNGYIDGETVTIEIYNAEKDRNKARSLLKEALKIGKPDLVISVATIASQETYKLLKDTEIPQLFFYVTDPVKAGIIEKMDVVTNKNITGFAHVLKNEMLMEITLRILETNGDKKPYNIGFFYTSYPSSNSDFLNIQRVDKNNTKINIIPLFIEQLPMPEGFAKMFKSTEKVLKANREKYDYIWLSTGPHSLNSIFLDKLVNLIEVPIIFGANMLAVKKGALLSVVSTANQDGRYAGEIAIQILQGIPAGDIPVTRSKHFEVGVNLLTADKLGSIVPSDILDLARNNIIYED
ncbi:MAG: hypothetical protein OCD02_00235 [Spirochaetaceae bacterium]